MREYVLILMTKGNIKLLQQYLSETSNVLMVGICFLRHKDLFLVPFIFFIYRYDMLGVFMKLFFNLTESLEYTTISAQPSDELTRQILQGSSR